MSGLVFRLAGNQRLAGDPQDNVWLSASAGTGKTQVLSARVLRLLLRSDVAPSQILCLTFTKAGAAEMANRINAVLARWVRLPDAALAKELDHLGADIDPATLERARSLFACVLDCPGGGLRIDTIHAFSQFLIASFPEEAGMVPGAEVMEDRTRDLLAREVLTDVLEDARRAGDTRLLDAVEFFITRKEPAALQKWLMRAADAPDLWKGAGAWQSPMDARVRQLLGIPADAGEEWINAPLDPDIFPDDHVLAMIPPLEDWGTASANKCLDFIREWLSLDHAGRIEAVGGFRGTVLKSDGTPSLNLKKPRETCPEFAEAQEMIAAAIQDVETRRNLLASAQMVTAALEIGRAFALRWEERKAREGLLDFSDLIRKAAMLLSDQEASAWIRYKLDRHFDHILIDEAQDTNQSQWDVVFALIDDFFSGEGARGDKLRTIFTVGDYKQAIFGFQGTSPENFARAKTLVETRIRQARDGMRSGGGRGPEPGWKDLDLGQSFRTSGVVLDFVNAMIDALGYQALGLDRAPTPHVGEDRPGLVTLWPPVVPGRGEDDEESESDAGERDWLPRHDVLLAERIADQVQRWVSGTDPFVLAKGRRRHAGPGDIMVLVRQRKDLAAQIVAKLFARGVPVAGVDRLRLGAPLAVRDVLAALRFAAQPLDDLSLANLLASPLIGWSQDDLLAHVARGDKVRLWDHLRRPGAPAAVADVVGRLRELLRLADYQTPQALITWILTGPWQGRARLVERLGSEVNDPLDELINAAFVYEAEQWPSLSGFLQWFDAGTGELKRDADSGAGQVRVMTVHGSKGLQAPIVILADATGAPGEAGDITLIDDPLGLGEDGAGRAVPLPPLAKHERIGPIADAEAKAQAALMQEHWRLLYVAATRAEEALFICGSLNRSEAKRGAPHDDSWYARLAPLFPAEFTGDPVWTWRRELGRRAEPLTPDELPAPQDSTPVPLPDWVHRPIGAEPRPPRPLAPSNLGEDRDPEPPASGPGSREAARRGDLVHRLLERLPDVAPDAREPAARGWLAQRASDLTEVEREDILVSAIRVLDHPEFARIFTAAALAEVPLTASVGGTVIAGTVDRLLVEDGCVTVIDFKTTRRPPASAAEIPPATVRQMAAYVAALEAIYPDAEVRAAVLYTHVPVLIEIPSAILANEKQQLEQPQESLFPRDIE